MYKQEIILFTPSLTCTACDFLSPCWFLLLYNFSTLKASEDADSACLWLLWWRLATEIIDHLIVSPFDFGRFWNLERSAHMSTSFAPSSSVCWLCCVQSVSGILQFWELASCKLERCSTFASFLSMSYNSTLASNLTPFSLRGRGTGPWLLCPWGRDRHSCTGLAIIPMLGPGVPLMQDQKRHGHSSALPRWAMQGTSPPHGILSRCARWAVHVRLQLVYLHRFRAQSVRRTASGHHHTTSQGGLRPLPTAQNRSR